MSEGGMLDARLRVPYSISTGIPGGGDAEIEGYLQSLRLQGFCVIDRVIPQDGVEAARQSVLEGRALLQEDRAQEREKRIAGARERDPDVELGDGPVRPLLPPAAEICDVEIGRAHV